MCQGCFGKLDDTLLETTDMNFFLLSIEEAFMFNLDYRVFWGIFGGIEIL